MEPLVGIEGARIGASQPARDPAEFGQNGGRSGVCGVNVADQIFSRAAISAMAGTGSTLAVEVVPMVATTQQGAVRPRDRAEWFQRERRGAFGSPGVGGNFVDVISSEAQRHRSLFDGRVGLIGAVDHEIAGRAGIAQLGAGMDAGGGERMESAGGCGVKIIPNQSGGSPSQSRSHRRVTISSSVTAGRFSI